MKITSPSAATGLIESSIDLSVLHHGKWEIAELKAVEGFDTTHTQAPFGLLVVSPSQTVLSRLRASVAEIADEEEDLVQVIPFFHVPPPPISPPAPSVIPPDLTLLVVSADETVYTIVNGLISDIAADFAKYGKTIACGCRREKAGDIAEDSPAFPQISTLHYGYVFEISSDWMPDSLVDIVFKTIAAAFGPRQRVIEHWSIQTKTLKIAVLPPGCAYVRP